ncbi:MAG: NADH-quinone oxidoreductase subunit J [Gammaproteobacteria bacterium]|nr:NADH-quinone oxidoreductase subunit J [Gammaproteobacteria bacterium]
MEIQSFQQVSFYFFGAVLLLSAFMVVTMRNPVKSALFLVLSFFSAAGIWMLLEAEFLSISLVLVYVGAVMVLFLFVVMMLDINIAELRSGFGEYLPMGALVAVLLIIELAIILSGGQFGLQAMPDPAPHAADYSNTRELGLLLYTAYIYPLELAALLLLVAIVAAIALTMRKRKTTKYQDPGKQVQVQAKDRLKIVKMPSERKS